MIIVEGPDGSGKSTLIEQIKQRWGFEVAPRVVDKKARALVDLKRWVEDNLKVDGSDPNMIYDRHRLISEPIYGPILREVTASGFNNLVWLNWAYYKFYTEVKPYIIYCLPPLHEVKNNCYHDPKNDNAVVYGYVDKIYGAYAVKAATDMALYPSRCTIYDYTTDGREEDPLACFDSIFPFKY